MSNFFIGDVEYKLSDIVNSDTPCDFGCSRSEAIHYDAYSEQEEDIRDGIQKYKEQLLEIGIDPKEMSSNELKPLSLEEVQSKWQLSKDKAEKVCGILSAYCLGLDILACVKKTGECHFQLFG